MQLQHSSLGLAQIIQPFSPRPRRQLVCPLPAETLPSGSVEPELIARPLKRQIAGRTTMFRFYYTATADAVMEPALKANIHEAILTFKMDEIAKDLTEGRGVDTWFECETEPGTGYSVHLYREPGEPIQLLVYNLIRETGTPGPVIYRYTLELVPATEPICIDVSEEGYLSVNNPYSDSLQVIEHNWESPQYIMQDIYTEAKGDEKKIAAKITEQDNLLKDANGDWYVETIH